MGEHLKLKVCLGITHLLLTLRTVNTCNISVSSTGQKIDPKVHCGQKSLEKVFFLNSSISALRKGEFDKFIGIKELSLANSGIATIDPETFQGASSLKKLHLQENRIKTLSQGSLDSLNHVEVLDFSGNFLENLSNDVFDHLVSLRRLNLSRNNISSVDLAFHVLSNLEVLDLSHNIISSIHQQAFENNKVLKTLILSHNQLTNVTMRVKAVFTMFDLSFNSIYAYQISGFKHSVTFDMSHNVYPDSINVGSFKHYNLSHNNFTCVRLATDYVEYIDASWNFISELNQSYFQPATKIKAIDLSHNRITLIDCNFFQDKRELKYLNISYNLLNEIVDDLFNGVVALEDLNLSNNQIKQVQHKAFISLKNLKSLDLSRNHMEEALIGLNEGELLSLKILNLSYNSIAAIHLPDLHYLPALEVLDLSHNVLHQIDLVPFHVLRRLILKNNELSKLNLPTLNISKKVELIDASYNLLQLIKNPPSATVNLRSNKMREANITDVYVALSNNLLDNFTISSVETQYVDLSNNNITSLDSYNFIEVANLIQIDLSYNQLSSIHEEAFKRLVSLKYLNLSHNSLFDVRFGTFDGLVSLATLDISYNNFVYLYKSPVYFKNLDIFQRVENIFFGNNPWSCRVFEKIVDLINITNAFMHCETYIKDFEVDDERLLTFYLQHNKTEDQTSAMVDKKGEAELWQSNNFYIFVTNLIVIILVVICIIIVLAVRSSRRPKKSYGAGLTKESNVKDL